MTNKLCWTFFGIIAVCQCAPTLFDGKTLKIDLTVSARLQILEISWFNINPSNGVIIVTDQEPTNLGDFTLIKSTEPFLHVDDQKYYYQSNETNNFNEDSEKRSFKTDRWVINGPNNRSVVYTLDIDQSSGWHRTNIRFNNDLLKNVSISTKCYGYWAIYLNESGERRIETCIQAYPLWMNEMKEQIGKFKFRDLFIVGSHDSGSYRENFDPTQNETLVTKYSITQDFDIYTQLLHGIRYLDIRVAYYRASTPNFWVNHGIARLQPLDLVLQQVRDFILETNELVIFDIQEFPVGFGRDLSIHRRLVQYVNEKIGDLIVDPNLTWQATLNDIWQTKRNIIVGYDHIAVAEEFSGFVYHAVEQRWGNVQTVADLRRFLEPSNRRSVLYTSRPVSDMAELTPTTWDVITDRFGGLRRMADETNAEVSKWYFEEWGLITNIVSVDFFRGTSLMSTSLYWNSKKKIH